MSSGDWVPSAEGFKYDQNAHYNVSKQEIVEPLTDIKLIPVPANPGGSKTLWISTVDGALHYGAGAVQVANTPGLLATRAEFYGLTAGTGNLTASDYLVAIPAKTMAGSGRVPFPRDNTPANAGGIVRSDPSSFFLPNVGTYEVSFDVQTVEPGQLMLELNGVDLPWTVSGNQNSGTLGHTHSKRVLITTAVSMSVLAVINPVGNTAALDVTAADAASTHANSQNLVIRQIA
jgi:hypothetical protein